METNDMINRFKKFFDEYYLSKITDNINKKKGRVTIEFKDLAKFDIELAEDLIEQPEDTLKGAELAIEQMGFELEGKFKVRVRGDIPESKFRVRDLIAKHLGRFVTIEGTIETKTDKAVRMTTIKYECPSCNDTLNVLQLGDELAEPTKCSCGRKGKFRLVNKELMDCFTLRLQELTSSIKYGSHLPTKSVLCEGDLADAIIEEKLIEGTKIKINGIYKDKIIMKRGKKQTQLVTYIDTNYIQLSEETFYDIELNKKDIKEIKEFAEQDNLLSVISQGLFQGIYGYDRIKEALTLQAFGGVSDYESTPKVRGDIHILLVGDAGQNKSVFLEYTSKFLPKCVLVVGKSVSAVGMSGAVIKDELTGSFVLKPGAIPLANNGQICIDELDKMKEEDRDILHEPMEQQRISISKANIADRKMLSRESFLISMNPKNSYFNNFDPIYKQIDLPKTLIDRFDLIYTIKKVREKTEETRQMEKEKAKMMMTRNRENKQEKLKDFHKFMRKYIAYARQFVNPRMDKHLEEEYLPEKYAGLDHEHKSNSIDYIDDAITTSPRHLFMIKRIAEAYARLFLRDKVTVDDVDFAVGKVKDSLNDIALDKDTGRIDQDWVVDGVPSNRKKLIEIFDEVYDKLVRDDGNVFTDDLYHEMATLGFDSKEVDDFLDKKSQMKDIFRPRHHLIRKLE